MRPFARRAILGAMSELPLLDALDQRILGALMEKERTVPSTYPLTLNALRTACNQTSSRDPVTDHDERTIERALSALKLRGLVRFDHSARGSRTMKYHQRLVEALDLRADERAILTVLLLRGANAPGELRTRTERMHAFADRTAVEDCLRRMAERPQPLVREIPRRPGWHDPRWIHLLGPVAVEGMETDPAQGAPNGSPDAASVEDGEARDRRVVATYDTVAATYADTLLTELDDKPFDRWFLTRIAGMAGPQPVADVGCGPGHVTAFLADAGATVTGFDVSPGMVAEAERRFPQLSFAVADLRALPAPAGGGGWGAVTAWYALCHLTASEIREAIEALVRALRPRGVLALALHAGHETRHMDEWWGHEVDVDFVLHDPQVVRTLVAGLGLQEVEWYLRSPYAGVEIDTERLHIVGRRAG